MWSLKLENVDEFLISTENHFSSPVAGNTEFVLHVRCYGRLPLQGRHLWLGKRKTLKLFEKKFVAFMGSMEYSGSLLNFPEYRVFSPTSRCTQHGLRISTALSNFYESVASILPASMGTTRGDMKFISNPGFFVSWQNIIDITDPDSASSMFMDLNLGYPNWQ
jgi:hypothetical protein